MPAIVMPIGHGRVIFDATAARQPWAGTHAHAPALTATLDSAVAAIDELDRRSRTVRHAGFFSYDLGQCFETLPTHAVDDLKLPALAFVPVTAAPPPPFVEPTAVSPQARLVGSTFTPAAYRDAVRRCLAYVSAGDVFQINLSQRLAVRTPDTPAAVFARLRRQFPAAFAALLEFDGFALVSNSPELFLRVARRPDGRRTIVTRPIKGTRPNAPGMHAQLLASEKDRAELAMIVDLQRNDLGRICETGSVRVTEPRTIETHPTVLHGVATVEGVLRDGITLLDILRATFPCGSITGCPKIRAMQIIDELEPVRRGAYCGAIGWVENGELELSVAIRTITFKDGVAYVPVGGGVVADSSPDGEFEETLVKARAMLTALGVA